MLVGASARPGLRCFRGLHLCHIIRFAGLGGRTARRLGQRVLDQRLAVVDGSIRRGFIDRFAFKAAHIHFGVGCDDDQVGGRNLSIGQCILRAHGPLGFHLNRVAQRFRPLLQTFGCHEGVSDSSRARGDCDDIRMVHFGGAGRRRRRCLGKRVLDHTLAVVDGGIR